MDEERKEAGNDDMKAKTEPNKEENAEKAEKEPNKAKKKQKGRRAYLSDFTANVNGEYVFMGDSYEVAGKYPERGRKILVGVGFAIVLVTIALGSVPYEASIKCFYVVIPLALQCIFALRLAWIVGRMVVNKGPLRSYIYKKTVEKFDLTSWLVLIAAIVTSMCWLVYTILNGFGESTIASLGFAFLQTLNVTLIVAFNKLNKKIHWDLV